MSWFPQLRAVAYLKRISESLERIADFADSQVVPGPRLSRKGEPKGEIFRPSIGEWNARFREDHPEMEFTGGRDDV